MKAYHFYFKGSVQGVGFRYTARQIAKHFGLSGWVKNLSDGRVEALAQGDQAGVAGFLADLRGRFSGYLRDYTMNEVPLDSELDDFRVTF